MDHRDTTNATDLASLRSTTSLPEAALPDPEARSLSDYAVDALIPIMIFTMMLSVTWFLLDIRFVYTERLDLNMRAFAFFFVLGVVALNRLKAERGLADSAVYIGGLAIAVGVFTVLSQLKGGGVAGGYLPNMLLSLCFNISVVVILWKVTDRLTRDCCVDTSSRYGDEGILRSRWRRPKTPPPVPEHDGEAPTATPQVKRPPRKHPAHALFYLALPILAMLAAGQRILPQGGSFLESAGSVYVGTYTASMLMLLLLSSYRGLRVYCQRRNITFPTSIAAFWLGLGTIMVALVFFIGLWGPVPTTPERAQHLTRSYSTTGATASDRWDYHDHEREGEGTQSRPEEGANPGEGSDGGAGAGQEDPKAPEGPHSGNEDHPQGQGGEQGSQEDQGGQEQQGGQDTGQEQGEQRTGETPQGAESTAGGNPPKPPAAEIPMNELMNTIPALKWLGYGVLAIVGLFVLYLMLQAAAHFFGKASHRGGRFRTLFQRLAHLFRRLTYVPKRKPRRARVRIDRDIATCAPYQNPLNGPLSLRAKIQYSYDALCALAYDLGVPREEDQTPFEFLDALPEPIAEIEAEAHTLTHLYVAGTYSALTLPDTVLEDLRAFWIRYERLRRKVLR